MNQNNDKNSFTRNSHQYDTHSFTATLHHNILSLSTFPQNISYIHPFWKIDNNTDPSTYTLHTARHQIHESVSLNQIHSVSSRNPASSVLSCNTLQRQNTPPNHIMSDDLPTRYSH